MNANLMLHCGAELVTREALAGIPMPEATNSYSPLAHIELVNMLEEAAINILEPKGYKLDVTTTGITKDGNRLFGIMKLHNGDADMGMAVGFRNSYDKSMSVGMAAGGSVFVCDNLMLSGDVSTLQRHSGNIARTVQINMIGLMSVADVDFKEVIAVRNKLKEIPMSLERGYEVLGKVYGLGYLTPTMNNEAYRQWREPTHEVFTERNAWSLFNATTAAAKKAPVQHTLEIHTGLTQAFKQFVA